MFLKVEPHSSLGRPSIYIDTAEHPIDDLPCADRLRQGTPFTWEDLENEQLAAPRAVYHFVFEETATWICALMNYVRKATGQVPDERATYRLVANRDNL